MSIEIACPACMAINELDDDFAGTKVRCDECGKSFTAPSTKQAKKAAQTKANESSGQSTETRARSGPTRQQFIASLVMALLSLLALAAIAGFGFYSFWTDTPETKQGPPPLRPNTPAPDPKKSGSTDAIDQGRRLA